MGQVPGVDQHHFRARPDLHAVHDRARNRPQEDHPRRPGDPVCRRGQLLGGCILGILFFVGIGLALGGGSFDALYLCVACALSSTVIIVKVLYEKRELDTLPGRITLGILVLQDIFAILFLAVQPSLANLQVSVILISVARVGVLVATALVLSRYVLPRLFHQIARRPELILLGALAWCFLIGEIAEKLHLSREMGLAGRRRVAVDLPYALDVTAKVTTLRDFLSRCSLSRSA